ncbi:hypothetical protein [Streptomyces sp. NPDC020965]|uniref:hypothetical protein n=1 Tax=Streptomyces sp. NPDC020965 TaxID=3365105 RepID=UPI0037B17AA4
MTGPITESRECAAPTAVPLAPVVGGREKLAVRRAVEAITAPWPVGARNRVWHTACLALTVTALQQHLRNAEVPV